MSDKGIIFSAPMVRALLAGTKTQTRRLIKPMPFVDDMGNFCAPDRKGTVWNWGQNIDGTPCLRNFIKKMPYAAGDHLYVRESGCEQRGIAGGAGDLFRHDVPAHPESGIYWSRNNLGPGASYALPACSRAGFLAGPRCKVRPSIHMPRWASRITLAVTAVRVQRLQDISEADARAEGIVWLDPTEEDYRWARERGFPTSDMDGVWTVPGMRAVGADIWGVNPQQCYHLLWDTLHTKPGERWDDNPWIVAVTFDVDLRNIDAVRS